MITAATIEGDGVHIAGFLYGADFPAVVAEIQSKKALLGFSYEAQAAVADWNSNPVEVTSCVFTGAAILLKDKAAYTTTSLEASASSEIQMTPEELQAMLGTALSSALKPITDDIAALKASAGNLEAANVLHKVKTHADALRGCADGLEAAGMGGHERLGHVAVLRRMADKMEAEAVLGKLPHVWRDHDWLEAGAATAGAGAGDKSGERIAALEAEITDLKARAFQASGAPKKPTDEAPAAKPGLHAAAAAGDAIGKRDIELKASGASTVQRLAAITEARMTKAA